MYGVACGCFATISVTAVPLTVGIVPVRTLLQVSLAVRLYQKSFPRNQALLAVILLFKVFSIFHPRLNNEWLLVILRIKQQP